MQSLETDSAWSQHHVPTETAIMGRLRSETSEAHRQTEAIPFSAAMVAEALPKHLYVAQLHAYHVVHAALEDALESCHEPIVRAVWRAEQAKHQALENDLRDLDPQCRDADNKAQAIAARFARRIDELRQCDPIALLGHLYVLEGSMLGAAILRRHLIAAYDLEDEGLAYYSGYGRQTAPMWKAFKERMDAAITTREDQDRVVAAAIEAFERVGDILRALSEELEVEFEAQQHAS